LGLFDIPPVAKQQLAAISTLVMVVLQRGWYNRLDQLILPEDWHVFFVVAAVLCRIVATLRDNQRRTMTVRKAATDPRAPHRFCGLTEDRAGRTRD
jgi:hypothetical protein